MSKEYRYDPETHVSARELRDRGFPIPDHIPDAASVPKGSWRLVGDFKVDVGEDGKTMKLSYGELVFDEPFCWIGGTLTFRK